MGVLVVVGWLGFNVPLQLMGVCTEVDCSTETSETQMRNNIFSLHRSTTAYCHRRSGLSRS